MTQPTNRTKQETDDDNNNTVNYHKNLIGGEKDTVVSSSQNDFEQSQRDVQPQNFPLTN